MTTALELIDVRIEEYKELEKYLSDQKELSFMISIQQFALKSILLSIASLYETEIISLIHEVLETEKSDLLRAFVSKKALERQYHALFDWEKENANKFFAYFGKDFADYAKKRVNAELPLEESTKAFVELGAKRNLLVHLNYMTYPLDWTIDDISDKFKKSKGFIDGFRKLFREYKPC